MMISVTAQTALMSQEHQLVQEEKFYCKNIGHSPSLLYSSRVNDGICDCCDGSDEYDGKVKCPNTCNDAIAIESLKRNVEVYQEGVTLRKQEIEQAKRAIARDRAELSMLKREREVVGKLVSQLDELVQKLEQEHEEEENKMSEARNEKVKNKKSGPEENADRQIEPMKTSDVEKKRQSGESPSDQNEKDEDKNSEGLSREELGQLVVSRWTGKKTGEQVKEIDQTKNDQENDGQVDGYKESVADNTSRQSWLNKIQETAQSFLNMFSTTIANLDATQIRKEYNDYTSKLSDINSRISSLTEKFKHDFGKENEFYLFYDRCFESEQDKYVYKVRPFKDATQKGDNSETLLGKWDEFGNSHRYMLFTDGDECWNGPDRSLKVKLRCGLKTELTGMDEPSRCEYAALMYTPVLCLDEKLEEFKQKLESIDQVQEQQWNHDEL
ncbi:glucosidase 2 subunit beta-like [Hibiscus syriacus]|uniref:glucosidase 2 subunit beta-like n=1 Tax=Hibiscus syriacus TaxID=106335 RepID=UPI0019203DE5|nr:glucosidase 2 subunit beta-like [Hibiscus syriacus]